MDNLITIIFLALGAASLVSPRFGIIAIFPANLFIPAAPTGIDSSILAFIFIFVSIFIGILIRFRISEINSLLSSTHKLFILFILAMLLANVAIFFSENINLYKWFRGLVPFLFLSIYLPILILLAKGCMQSKEILWSIGFAGIITSAYLSYLYFSTNLSQPVWHLFQDGLRFDFNPNLPVPKNATVSGPLYLRVTLLWDKATTVLLVLLPICSLITATYTKSRFGFLAWTILLTISFMAMMLTYTRSMIFVFIVSTVLFGVMTFLWNTHKSSLKKYSLALAICILVNAVSSYAFGYYKPILSRSVFGFETVVNILLQNHQCSSKFTDYQCSKSGSIGVEGSSNKPIDQNIHTRLNEISIAIDAFSKKPLLGHGLGYEYALADKIKIGGRATEKVAYMHNIIFYLLMTTGLFGLIGYSLPIMYTLTVTWKLQRFRYGRSAFPTNIECVASIVTLSLVSMLIYACFFAVFRQISFNLILGALLGLGLAIKTTQEWVE